MDFGKLCVPQKPKLLPKTYLKTDVALNLLVNYCGIDCSQQVFWLRVEVEIEGETVNFIRLKSFIEWGGLFFLPIWRYQVIHRAIDLPEESFVA